MVELLVVIAIIGTLVALLLPAVQAARGTARTAQCASQLGELAKGTVAYEASKGNFPVYSQYIQRGSNIHSAFNYQNQKVTVVTVTDPDEANPFAWPTMLLRNLERQDIWDQIVDHTLEPVLPRMDVFACPGDTDANSIADRPVLSYIANTGTWDRDGSNFLGDVPAEADKGDVAANGVMFNEAAFSEAGMPKKTPKTRLSGIKDGANMTILYSENIHRTYEPDNPSDPPNFSWAYGNEQQVGMVWVVPPVSGLTPSNQEAINRNVTDPASFPTDRPQFARPASTHNGGVNAAFCDGHVQLISENIDYTVYQRLLTTNGAKCEDPLDHEPKTPSASPQIRTFRTLPPLSESDF